MYVTALRVIAFEKERHNWINASYFYCL